MERYDLSAIKNLEWLNSGGAEIILEVVRRMGWNVEIANAEGWYFLPNIVSVGDRKGRNIYVSGAKPPWLQATAAAATACTDFKYIDGTHHEYAHHVFHDDEMLLSTTVREINGFIGRAKLCVEVTIDLVGADRIAKEAHT